MYILRKHILEGGLSTAERGERFYLVRESILPEAIRKTALVKMLLDKGEAKTVNEAVAKAGLSRSAYYKYRDGVFPFYTAAQEKIVTLSLTLEHRAGVLSRVLNTIAGARGNILTINQNIPLQGLAHVSISLETAELRENLEDVLYKLRHLDGVKKVEIVGQS
ncbi:ACT domain-containing protein [Calderihabitans maritimus]|uniref:UPF0735 ACT domain-containing protein KKC1_23840 n=1 Tax=Calderihabitans maritimus TaxID=1246530 RepID=A0A1Z5HV86_9FIRM|nr:ACT domain-containing protein [Calderihabitans maritimus]GAW93245.1 hypothetical protein KKC1_23840 [Calderihabitans maritimus]